MKPVCAFLTVTMLCSCQLASKPQANNETVVRAEVEKTTKPLTKNISVWYTAKVSYISNAGGFYGLVTDGGEKFLPLNLPENFKKDGLFVKVYGTKATNTTTVHEWGVAFEVKQINLLTNEK